MARGYRKGISASEAFKMLEKVALAGARCPVSRVNGLTSQLTSELARTGKIRIDVYPHNYRVITILAGPHAGRATAPPPNKTWRPYLTIEKGSEPKPQYTRISP
jgi:hypothetical protein